MCAPCMALPSRSGLGALALTFGYASYCILTPEDALRGETARATCGTLDVPGGPAIEWRVGDALRKKG
jgi:hypothetical protein